MWKIVLYEFNRHTLQHQYQVYTIQKSRLGPDQKHFKEFLATFVLHFIRVHHNLLLLFILVFVAFLDALTLDHFDNNFF
jgi:hypothetical protein